MNNWIEWKGGERPVDAGTLVDVRYRDGQENLHVVVGDILPTGSHGSRIATDWSHDRVAADIVAYRLHQPEQSTQIKQLIAKRDKQAEKVKRQTAKLDRLNEEIKHAIAQLEREVERDTGLACRITEPAGDGIPKGVDADDPATWQKGDVIECLETESACVTEGERYTYMGRKDSCGDLVLERDDHGGSYAPPSTKYKFISRPQ